MYDFYSLCYTFPKISKLFIMIKCHFYVKKVFFLKKSKGILAFDFGFINLKKLVITNKQRASSLSCEMTIQTTLDNNHFQLQLRNLN